LRARIAALERSSSASLDSFLQDSAHHDSAHAAPVWTLGAPRLDRRLAGGLDAAALHEVKPESPTGAAAGASFAGAWAAALGFAVRLAVRRVEALDALGTPARILWCWPCVLARELGLPYGQGLAFLGLEPSSCLFVETQRAGEALWAMEEGLKSASLALVIGILPAVALTPARRLSLAAASSSTPCLIVTDSREPAAGSTATRWRVGARASAPHPFEAGAPGAARYAVALERCRDAAQQGAQALSLLLEWSDETHRFRVAPAMAHRAHGPRRAGLGAR
jgi:protein ImuA